MCAAMSALLLVSVCLPVSAHRRLGGSRRRPELLGEKSAFLFKEQRSETLRSPKNRRASAPTHRYLCHSRARRRTHGGLPVPEVTRTASLHHHVSASGSLTVAPESCSHAQTLSNCSARTKVERNQV